MTWLAVQTLCRPCDYLLVRLRIEEPCLKVANELSRLRESDCDHCHEMDILGRGGRSG
jgi:hypothetical protein